MERRFLLTLIGLVAILLAVAPASALAEELESSPTTETPPPSSGWVPQGGTPESSGGGSSGAQQGSSLGSGGSSGSASKPSPPSPPPAPSPAPEPAPPSSSYEETEATVEPPPQEPEPIATPAPEPEPAPAKPDPKPPAHINAHVDLASADAVLEGSGGVKGVSTSSATVAPAAQVASDSGGLPWLALIVFSLILVVAGMRLVLGPFEADSLRYSRFKFLRRAAPRP